MLNSSSEIGRLSDYFRDYTARSICFHPVYDMMAVASGSNIYFYTKNGIGEYTHLTLTGHSGNVNSITFSPDGLYLVSGGDDATVRLWDLKEVKQINIMKGHNQAVRAVRFSPDGKHIVSGGDDQISWMWDFIKNEPKKINQHTSSIININFQIVEGQSQLVLISTNSTSIWKFDITKNEYTFISKTSNPVLQSSHVNNNAFSSDKKCMAVTDKNSVSVWNIAITPPLLIAKLPSLTAYGLRGAITSIEFDEKTNTFVLGDELGSIFVFKNSWQLPYQILQSQILDQKVYLHGIDLPPLDFWIVSMVSTLIPNFNINQPLLASEIIKLKNLTLGQQDALIQWLTSFVNVSRVKKDSISVSNAAQAITALNALRCRFDKFCFSGVSICGADLSGAILSKTNFQNADLRGVNLNGVNIESANFKKANLTGVCLTSHLNNYITSFCYSPDGKFLAVASESFKEKKYAEINVFDTHDQYTYHSTLLHQKEISNFTFSSDGKFVFVFDSFNRNERTYRVQIYDVKTKELLETLKLRKSNTFCSSPCEQYRLEAASNRINVLKKEGEDYRVITNLHDTSIIGVTGLKYGDKFILTKHWNNALRIWDAKTYQLMAKMYPVDNIYNHVENSPDKQCKVSISTYRENQLLQVRNAITNEVEVVIATNRDNKVFLAKNADFTGAKLSNANHKFLKAQGAIVEPLIVPSFVPQASNQFSFWKEGTESFNQMQISDSNTSSTYKHPF